MGCLTEHPNGKAPFPRYSDKAGGVQAAKDRKNRLQLRQFILSTTGYQSTYPAMCV